VFDELLRSLRDGFFDPIVVGWVLLRVIPSFVAAGLLVKEFTSR
jgi:hypothetical protein